MSFGAASLVVSGIAGFPAKLPARSATEARTLLVLGDSLSAEYGLRRGAGWVEMLAARLASRHPAYAVVNASISGETTAGGRARIAELLARYRPAIVIIELGGNDALRGLDLAATERNLAEMVRLTRASSANAVLVGMKLPPNYGRTYSKRFVDLFAKVARSERAALVPFLLEGVSDTEFFQDDRLHPNERAQTGMLENVWPVLTKLLG